MHWEVTAGYGTKRLCKDYGDNVGIHRLPAGRHVDSSGNSGGFEVLLLSRGIRHQGESLIRTRDPTVQSGVSVRKNLWVDPDAFSESLRGSQQPAKIRCIRES